MPVRYLDSVICPLLFGLGPFLLLGLLTAYIPRFSAWVVTWPGALITAGGCLVIIARGYWLLGDDPGPNAAEEARWARRLPSFIVPLLVCTHTRHAEMPDSLYRPYLALDIDALEAGELDLPDRLFKHSGWRFTTVLSVDPREWLFPDVKGLRGKLDALLLEEGLGKPKGKVWLVTMPRLLGASVKAPLSLWFVYGTQGDLEVVILERHWTMGNTSAERSTDTVYTHCWAGLDDTFELRVADPFPHPPTTSTIPTLRVSFESRTPSSESHIMISPYQDVQPAPLRIPKTGHVWTVLLHWPLSLIPAEIRERGFVNSAIGAINGIEEWVRGTLSAGGRWTRRGQDGLHTA